MYLTAREARERINVSRETFTKLIKSGDLKASRLGQSPLGHWRIREEDLDEYMERQAARAAS